MTSCTNWAICFQNVLYSKVADNKPHIMGIKVNPKPEVPKLMNKKHAGKGEGGRAREWLR